MYDSVFLRDFGDSLQRDEDASSHVLFLYLPG